MSETIIGEIVKVELTGGLNVHVQALSPILIRDIVHRAEKVHPDPDPKPFEKKIENSFAEGGVISGRDNPDYQKLLAQVHYDRVMWAQEHILRAAVSCPEEKAILNHYEKRLNQLKKSGVYTSDEDNPFFLCLRYFIATESDLNTLVLAAQKKGFLTQEEVANGIAFFRLEARRDSDRGSAQ